MRSKSNKHNSASVTLRVEPKYVSDLKLYSQVVGRNQSEILRELLISALNSIPEHQRRAMEIIAQCRTSN
ncbi:hypothetical protein GNF10_33620 [Nostoc sp. UCD121]|jgi:hypothetical protein|uniref:Uncharacterized protein n=5 Tax=Nostoc TaxID=1177 RepID=A0A367S4K2_NOSPU|nr:MULTISPECIES: hypothetical protein [Nostoc]MBC1225238.1 hypothetical protein [Nostoc sp. UCD120]MBC1296956.1 hypothetical protein [Nostoc sp. UCD122]MBD2511425.1 hypothetical protein [Desmonostoc muscorum FACHB-395]MCC5654134.1 hypothetical protein [Nostoc sp. XA013]RCJ42804.1 hypothetical protein A6769_36770 [Nostoc punctiforme NIES-2108]